MKCLSCNKDAKNVYFGNIGNLFCESCRKYSFEENLGWKEIQEASNDLYLMKYPQNSKNLEKFF